LASRLFTNRHRRAPIVSRSTIPFSPNYVCRFISLTAPDVAGNTSQFSDYRPYTCDVIFKHGFDTATADKCP
jgi:hypothetical protein